MYILGIWICSTPSKDSRHRLQLVHSNHIGMKNILLSLSVGLVFACLPRQAHSVCLNSTFCTVPLLLVCSSVVFSFQTGICNGHHWKNICFQRNCLQKKSKYVRSKGGTKSKYKDTKKGRKEAAQGGGVKAGGQGEWNNEQIWPWGKGVPYRRNHHGLEAKEEEGRGERAKRERREGHRSEKEKRKREDADKHLLIWI